MYTNWTRMNIDKWSYQQLNKGIGQWLNVWYKTNCKGYFCTCKYIYDIRQLWASWFFFYLFCYSPDTKTIYILWDLLFISWLCADLKYYKNWNHSKMANANVPRTPSLPHPGDFFRSDPRTMQPILFYSISIPVFNKLKNNHILTALW